MKHMTLTLLLTMTILAAGCSKGGEQAKKPNPKETLIPASLFVTEAPAGEIPIAQIKSNAEKFLVGEEVVVTGVIGGRMAPLAAKFASMCIVCESLPVPKEVCGCGHPKWVFTCTPRNKLTPHQACVQILDGTMPIKASFEGVKGITGGKMVSVKGTIASNENGGLVITATEIYVHPAGKAHEHGPDGDGAAPAPAPKTPAEPAATHVHGPGCTHGVEPASAPKTPVAPAATHVHGPGCTHGAEPAPAAKTPDAPAATHVHGPDGTH